MARLLNRNLVAVLVALAVVATAWAILTPLPGAQANPTCTPGDDVIGGGTLVDNQSGNTFTFGLRAKCTGATGVGSIGSQLGGPVGDPTLSLCSVHGPGAAGGVGLGFPFSSGNFPLTEVECGTASIQSVEIAGCDAKLSFHGYVHADHPNATFLGMMTADLKFVKKSATKAEVDMTVHTPKEKIHLNGTVTAAFSIFMTTCPNP